MMRQLLVFLFAVTAVAETVVVKEPAGLRSALASLKSGTTVQIAPGDYPGSYQVRGVDRLTLEALDEANPPHFKGGANAFHFSRCNDLSLRQIKISGQSSNGLNLDDGGQLDSPVTGITMEGIEISDIGPRGNHDGIKCSGLKQLTIRNCVITGWGGQGIDFVGCHDSLVTGCRFVGKEGYSATAAVQMKGGSSGITVEKCQFINAGERPLNIGGSTGMPFFRPQGVKHEASQIIVRDNEIEGSLCAAAFVGVDGAEFSGNTVRYPTKWLFRILQETSEPGFTPCRNVVIKNNRITFRRAQVQTDINIGGGTAPESFRFEGNRWHAEDRPQASKPQLPTVEVGGIYGS